MRQIIADVYKIIYKISGYKLFSLIFALSYIAILNLILIYGLVLLLDEWMAQISSVLRFLSFPYNIAVFIILALINYLLMLPISNLSKEKSRPPQYIPLIIYTFIGAIICVYVHYQERIF